MRTEGNTKKEHGERKTKRGRRKNKENPVRKKRSYMEEEKGAKVKKGKVVPVLN
jgi:hypothetical protein